MSARETREKQGQTTFSRWLRPGQRARAAQNPSDRKDSGNRGKRGLSPVKGR